MKYEFTCYRCHKKFSAKRGLKEHQESKDDCDFKPSDKPLSPKLLALLALAEDLDIGYTVGRYGSF